MMTIRQGTIVRDLKAAKATKADIDAGVYLGMFNTHSSVETFARACFAYALNRNFPLKMSSKNTILKKYDGLFVDTFERVYREEYFA